MLPLLTPSTWNLLHFLYLHSLSQQRCSRLPFTHSQEFRLATSAGFPSSCSLLTVHFTRSSANIPVRRDSCLSASVNLSICAMRVSAVMLDAVPPPPSIPVALPGQHSSLLMLSYMSIPMLCTTSDVLGFMQYCGCSPFRGPPWTDDDVINSFVCIFELNKDKHMCKMGPIWFGQSTRSKIDCWFCFTMYYLEYFQPMTQSILTFICIKS